MENNIKKSVSVGLRIGSILKARCPSCHVGQVAAGFFSIRDRCPTCNYNFHPEPGFYLGAMMVSFLLTAMLTVPPMIFLKLSGAEINVLVTFPFVEFLFLGTFLMFYSRILWLHLEFRISGRLADEPDHRK